MDALAIDALAIESLGIDVCDVLMEQLHLRPLNTLKERHPAKFAAEISFLDLTITLKQNPGNCLIAVIRTPYRKLEIMFDSDIVL